MDARTRIFVVSLLVAVAIGAAAEGGGEAETPLKIVADCSWLSQNLIPTQDSRINDRYQKIIVERTGVDATWQNIAAMAQSLEMAYVAWTAAGTMPQVIRDKNIFRSQDWSKLINEHDLAWTWDAAKVRKLLPHYSSRLEKYGVSVEEMLKYNDWNGINYYIPTTFSFTQFSKLASLEESKAANFRYYALGFRDDVLRRIFPGAKTEADLLAVYAKKGRISAQDIVDDIPVKSLDDLYRYLVKVKALNLKVGTKPLIPGALCSTSEYTGTVDWSLRTILGYHWSWPIIFLNPPTFEGSFFLRWSAEFREYLRWWNKLYNEGLLDPEIFVMKDDHYYQKVINGEYAVINFWTPVKEAREVGSSRGYGYRYFPVFYGGIKPIFNNTTQFIALRSEPVIITTTVSEADLPRVARWVDWYLSEEHDELAYWGTPDMYTGSGKARRYRPEFKDLENWAVYGADGGKDGKYFGIQNAFPAIPGDAIMPLGGISFFAREFTYPEAPYFVYPKDPAQLAAHADIWKIAEDTIYRTVWDDTTLFTHANWPTNEILAYLPSISTWDERMSDVGERLFETVVKMVTGPVAQFDAHWARFFKIYEDAGTGDLERECTAWMVDYYRTQVLPNRIRK